LQAGPRSEQIELTRAELATAETIAAAALRVYDDARKQHALRCEEAQAKVALAVAALHAAKRTRDRLQRLAGQRAATESEIDQAEKDVSICDAELAAARAALSRLESETYAALQKDRSEAAAEALEARRRLELLLAGPARQEIKAAEAKAARLDARRDRLQCRLQELVIRSPQSGVVTTRLLERKLGSRFGPGDLIAEVQQTDVLLTELVVSEKDVADVESGQPVVVKLRAWPGDEFPATVSRITPVAVEAPDESQPVSFLVTTLLDNRAGRLRPGMTGKAKICCGGRTLWELAQRRLAQHVRVEFWSWW
jgi:multidrug resistance efflux pump